MRTSTMVKANIPKYKEAIRSKRHVGIIGGTFNPIHNGHLSIAEQVYDSLQLDEIIFMPNAIPPHKIAPQMPSQNARLAMLTQAIANNPHFSLDLVEWEREGKSYTYDTMKLLTERYPNTQFYFIIGADSVMDLSSWYRIADLVELVQFVGVKRSGYQLETPFPVTFVDIVGSDVSSSIIRHRVQLNQSIRYLVPDQVALFIKEKGLYLG